MVGAVAGPVLGRRAKFGLCPENLRQYRDSQHTCVLYHGALS